MPEWPTGAGRPDSDDSLCDQITDFLQERFNAVHNGMGAHVVGDWLLMAEVVQADGSRALRILDSDLPIWRRLGLLEFLKQDAQTEGFIVNMTDRGDDDTQDA